MKESRNASAVSIWMIVIVVLAIGIGLVLLLIFFSFSDALSPEGTTFHTVTCQISNVLASYELLRDVGVHMGRPFCEPQEYDIDAVECNCDDFTAMLESEHPIAYLYDGDEETYASIIARDGIVKIDFEVKQVFEADLTDFWLTVNSGLTGSNYPHRVKIQFKEDDMWSFWEDCKTAEVPSTSATHELMRGKICAVPPKGKMRLIFDTLNNDDDEVDTIEIEAQFLAGGETFDINAFLELPPKTSRAAAEKYAYICEKESGSKECNEEWKKNWVAMKLGELAASCWSMGLQGKRQPGTFACYYGRIRNIDGVLSEDVDGDGQQIDDVRTLINNNMKKQELTKGQTYGDYLARNKIHEDCIDVTHLLDPGPPKYAGAILTHAIDRGYPSGSMYAIGYADGHVLSTLGIPPTSDKVLMC